MKTVHYARLIICVLSFMTCTNLLALSPQVFFPDTWEPGTLILADYNDVTQTSNDVNVSVQIDFTDTITKVSKYLFVDNAGTYTTCISDNKTLMKYMDFLL
jgi:hypothetical protein